MNARRAAVIAWRYYQGSWVLPAATILLAALAARDLFVSPVPPWIAVIEFPVFLFVVFAPFVDAAQREHRWHVARGSVTVATLPAPQRSWWWRQLRFAVSQFRQPWCWSLLGGKVVLLVLVSRFAPSVIKVVALAPDAVAIAAMATIVGTGWRRQAAWDRFVPRSELPRWAQRGLSRWPLTAAVGGMALALVSGGMAFYFLALDAWPLEFLCGIQGFWLAVSSLRPFSPLAAWRQTDHPTAAPPFRASRTAA